MHKMMKPSFLHKNSSLLKSFQKSEKLILGRTFTTNLYLNNNDNNNNNIQDNQQQPKIKTKPKFGSIWENVVDFFKTMKEGRKIKKVEKETKEEYTKILAATLLESIREQKLMRQEVEKKFSELSSQITNDFSSIKKEMNVNSITQEFEKKYGSMDKMMKDYMQESLKETLKDDLKEMEKELNMEKLLNNNESINNQQQPRTTATSQEGLSNKQIPKTQEEWAQLKMSKFKQMMEKEKQLKSNGDK
ncbi:hypothetical protein ABK040_012385 [Willaertia magna]